MEWTTVLYLDDWICYGWLVTCLWAFVDVHDVYFLYLSKDCSGCCWFWTTTMDEEHLLLIIISFPLSIGRLCLHHTCFLSLFLLLPLFFFFFFLSFFFFFFFWNHTDGVKWFGEINWFSYCHMDRSQWLEGRVALFFGRMAMWHFLVDLCYFSDPLDPL